MRSRSKRTALSKRFSKDKEQIRYRNQEYPKEGDDTCDPWNAEMVIHGIDEQWERCREDRSKEGVCRHSTRGIFLESVYQIVQSALKNSEEAEPHHGGSNTWGYPSGISTRCPSENEETCGDLRVSISSSKQTHKDTDDSEVLQVSSATETGATRNTIRNRKNRLRNVHTTRKEDGSEHHRR